MANDNPEAVDLNSLNKAQRRAVTSRASTVAILAGPGSGKTHTLTSRVVWLIQQAGLQPANVIVATFTVKAAREMKERLGRSLGDEGGRKLILGTFHSIARRYLASYGQRIGLDPKFNIADDGDTRAIIQRICKRHDLPIEPSYAKSWISKRKSKGTDSSSENGQKQKDQPSLLKCFQEYQEHMERSNLLDYDDLLVRCVELLRKHPSCVRNVQAVLIDEYQDTNGIQYELMKLFAQAKQRITIVGDPDQSIYGWRSAEIRNLHRLLRDFPNTDEVSLEENYRSSQSILDVSLNVIQQDKNRYQKVLLPVHKKSARPVMRMLKSSSAEGEWIVSEARRIVMMCGDMIRYEDVAILLRSAALSRHIESALGKAGIAYRMVGGHKFYDRKEIKILLDYLRVVHQPDNNDTVSRIINVPRRGFGDATIKSLIEEAEGAKLSLWSVICKHCRGERKSKTNIRSKMELKLNTELIRIITTLQQKAKQITKDSVKSLVDLVEQLLSLLNFKEYLEEEYPEDYEQRWGNVQELVNLVHDFMKDHGQDDDDTLPEIDGLEQARDDTVLGKFLANVSLASDAQRDNQGENKTSLVTISTIHAAKGLEWPVVFVPSVYTGSIPHARSEDIDEERRLLYVAMTRAQALLYLSCPLYGPQGLSNKVELSPFVSPFALTALAPKGPTFDRLVLESAAAILGRTASSEKKIFDKLPPMFSPEDDLFPVDPKDPKDPDGLDGDKDHTQKTMKRQRSNTAATSGNEVDSVPWKREYATTMEQSSDFTVASFPGFTSASAYETATRVSATKAAAKNSKSTSSTRRGPTAPPEGQKSLLGFVERTVPGTSARPHQHPSVMSSAGRHRVAMERFANRTAESHKAGPAIDPSLTNHRVSTVVSVRPLAKRKLGEEPAPSKKYACFSSSPPKQSSPEPPAENTAASKPVSETFRPATTFHATTFASALGNGNGAVRRPLGMGAPPSMDRLRKPFKPPTIIRPQGPAKSQ
jgi:DNA helicase II / ATP-dependent DNA helicase PcrA